MIFTPHIVVGAVIGAKTHNLGLIIIFGLLSHFILDMIPHWDYHNEGIINYRKIKDFRALILTLLKITLDGLIGLLIVFIMIKLKGSINTKYLFFILVGIFVSVLPDVLLGLTRIFGRGKLSEKYIHFHGEIIHQHKEKEGKITFLSLFTEILAIIISIIMFFS